MIKCRNILLLFLILSFSFASLAEDDKVDFKGSLKDIYKDIKKIRRSGGFKIMKTPSEEKKEFALCVSCDQLSGLVKEVNSALQLLAENEDRKNSSNRTIEKVAGLDALYHYTYDDRYEYIEPDCNRYKDSNLEKYRKDLSLDPSSIFFSKEVPLDIFNSLHIRDGRKRTYFYRGKGIDQDLIIRVDIHSKEKAKITYYKIEEIPPIAKADPDKSTEDEDSDKWELWGSSESPLDTEENYINYGGGVSIEHKDNIPRKLTLVKGSSLTSVSDIFSIKTDTEISTKKQIAAIAITNPKGDDYARVELDKDVLELRVPTKFEILDSGIELVTEYSINSKDEKKIAFGLSGEQGATTRLILQRDEFGNNSGALDRTQNITNRQTVSIQFQGDDTGRNEAWLRYKLIF